MVSFPSLRFTLAPSYTRIMDSFPNLFIQCDSGMSHVTKYYDHVNTMNLLTLRIYSMNGATRDPLVYTVAMDTIHW